MAIRKLSQTALFRNFRIRKSKSVRIAIYDSGVRPKAGVKKSSGILDSFFHDFKGGSMCQNSLHITSIFKIYNRINMEHYFLFLFHSLMIRFGNVSDRNSFSYQHDRGKP